MRQCYSAANIISNVTTTPTPTQEHFSVGEHYRPIVVKMMVADNQINTNCEVPLGIIGE